MTPFCDHCHKPHSRAMCYRDGCRRPECRTANKVKMSRYRAARERNGGKVTESGIVGGKLTVPAPPVAAQIRDLKKVMTYRRMGEMSGVTEDTLQRIGQRKAVYPGTAQAVQALWDDFCAPLAPDVRRWATAPLKVMVLDRYGSVRASPWMRDMQRIVAGGTVSTGTAEKWAERLGKFPHEIWDAWFGVAS